MELAVLVAVVALALVLAVTNGFLDAPDAVATSISTRALTPRVALAMATGMNLLGAFLGQQVAATVASVVTPGSGGAAGLVVVLAGLLGAVVWTLSTWRAAVPSSSTHALVGGLVGAAVASGSVVRWDVVGARVVLPLLVAPVVAAVLALALALGILWGFRHARPQRTRPGFRVAQTVSAAALALGHGLQDAQKTMGVILLALLAAGHVSAGDGPAGHVSAGALPAWVVTAAAVAIAAGTWAGGYRSIRTRRRRVVDLEPAQGFAAESVTAGVLYTAAVAYDAPVSTTHTITAAAIGAGSTRRLSAIRWGAARRILLAWGVTLPAAGLAGAAVYLLCALPLGLRAGL